MAREVLIEVGHIKVEAVSTGGRPIERWHIRNPVEESEAKG
jgi:hypothetical protein